MRMTTSPEETQETGSDVLDGGWALDCPYGGVRRRRLRTRPFKTLLVGNGYPTSLRFHLTGKRWRLVHAFSSRALTSGLPKCSFGAQTTGLRSPLSSWMRE